MIVAYKVYLTKSLLGGFEMQRNVELARGERGDVMFCSTSRGQHAPPAIQEDLNASFDAQWVIDAYTLALEALVLTAGSLADRPGRRRPFAIGLGIFWSPRWPPAWRLIRRSSTLPCDPRDRRSNSVRGVPCTRRRGFPAGRERGTAMGIYGATIGVSVAVGPLVGGALVDSLGWEWVFFINVPVGIAAIVVTYTSSARAATRTRRGWTGPASRPSARALPARLRAPERQRGGLG